MELIWLGLIVIVALGAYIQTVTGFGFGLIVMGIGGALELLSIAELAFIASLLSLLNGLSGLYGGVWRQAHFKAMGVFLVTALPMVWFGLYLLDHLGANAINLLQGLLGITMILVCLSSLLRPEPRSEASPKWHFALCGGFAGVLSGLFSTAGPPISYLMYRQPVPLVVIRATLLSIFIALAGFRTTTMVASGSVTSSMLMATVIGAPVVLGVTVLSRKYLINLIQPVLVKRMAMAMLVLSGMGLLIRALTPA